MHAGFPILCDRLYGGRAEIGEDVIGGAQQSPKSPEASATPVLARQALHARRIQFHHPETGQLMDVSAPLPDDFKTTLELLEKYRRIDN